jgi:hypothetical protein
MQRLPDPLAWLAAGIPLTLVVDLLSSSGPHSQQILVEEPADLSWVPQAHAA